MAFSDAFDASFDKGTVKIDPPPGIILLFGSPPSMSVTEDSTLNWPTEYLTYHVEQHRARDGLAFEWEWSYRHGWPIDFDFRRLEF